MKSKLKIFHYMVSGLLILCAGTLESRLVRADPSDEKTWKIINYWSKTCAPCRVEIPELNFLSQELAAFNVVVWGVNFDEDAPDVTTEIAERMGIEFPTLSMDKVETLHLVAPSVLPTTYILSPEDEVKAKLIGAQDRHTIKAKLAELFEGG